jgi:hypothetical protein
MASLYAVFQADGSQRCNKIGLPVLERTLAVARLWTQPGDLVQRWGPSGHPAGSWVCGDDYKLRKEVCAMSAPRNQQEREEWAKAHRAEVRETLARMSDDAIRHQYVHGAIGGIDREEIIREAKRRGIVS